MKIISNIWLTTMIVLLLSITNKTFAQCPVGETEVTIQFINGGGSPDEILWDYIAGGLISGLGPFTTADAVTTCVPDGTCKSNTNGRPLRCLAYFNRRLY